MTRSDKLLLRLYGIAAFALMGLAFAGLFSRKAGFKVPFVSTVIIPELHKHAVWGETLRGRSILLGGEQWFFLIVVGIVILLGILTALLAKLIRSLN